MDDYVQTFLILIFHISFNIIVLIFLDPNYHITPCPMYTHKKGFGAFKMVNLHEFLLYGVLVSQTQN
jgi:hypothetical protein